MLLRLPSLNKHSRCIRIWCLKGNLLKQPMNTTIYIFYREQGPPNRDLFLRGFSPLAPCTAPNRIYGLTPGTWGSKQWLLTPATSSGRSNECVGQRWRGRQSVWDESEKRKTCLRSPSGRQSSLPHEGNRAKDFSTAGHNPLLQHKAIGSHDGVRLKFITFEHCKQV